MQPYGLPFGYVLFPKTIRRDQQEERGQEIFKPSAHLRVHPCEIL